MHLKGMAPALSPAELNGFQLEGEGIGGWGLKNLLTHTGGVLEVFWESLQYFFHRSMYIMDLIFYK